MVGTGAFERYFTFRFGMIIAIDGPAGAGKSVVAKELSRRLGVPYLESGLIYRALARKALDKGVEFGTEAFRRWVESIDVRVEESEGRTSVFIDSERVERDLRVEEVSRLASKLAVDRAVRQRVLEPQRRLAQERGIVAEGRDMTTVVFPEADFKFFLDAEFEERVRRRYNLLSKLGYKVDIEGLREQTRERDLRDTTREVAPLRKAEDAICIDTTDLTVEQVVSLMLEKIR